MKYRLSKSQKAIVIFEIPTGTTIRLGDIRADKAKQLLAHLNSGGGFDGFTPIFVAR